MTDKQKFMKEAVILCDTREQRNQHIISELEQADVKYETCKLPFGAFQDLNRRLVKDTGLGSVRFSVDFSEDYFFPEYKIQKQPSECDLSDFD